MAMVAARVPRIVFQFMDMRTALHAMDTFEELGYDAELLGEGALPQVAIQVVNEDLTSALEIGQAYGGTLMEHGNGASGNRSFGMAYAIDSGEGEREHSEYDAGDPVSADSPEAHGSEIRETAWYNAKAGDSGLDGTEQHPPGEEEPLHDVSSEKYDHFSGDVRA